MVKYADAWTRDLAALAAKEAPPALSDERIKELWLYRENLHDGELMPQLIAFARALLAAAPPIEREPAPKEQRLWLWKNFVDGRPEFWAFDNPYPINLDNGDPQTLGEPCGYALVKPSRRGRTDVSDERVIAAIKRVWFKGESK